LEEIFKDDPVPTSLPWAETPSTTLHCSKPHQPGLERFQGGDIHKFSGHPVPVPHHPHSKFLPHI